MAGFPTPSLVLFPLPLGGALSFLSEDLVGGLCLITAKNTGSGIRAIWVLSSPILAVEPGANPITLLVLFPNLQDDSHPPMPPCYLRIH